MSDIVFIFPRTGLDVGGTRSPPYGLLYSASILHREGYKVRIIDQRFEDAENELEKELEKSPHCVGMSAMTGPQIRFGLELASRVKENSEVPVVWGGMHPTLLPQQTIEHPLIDIVVRGEGEYTFYELVKAIEQNNDLKGILGTTYKNNGNIIHNPDRPLMDLRNTHGIPWDLIDVERYIYNEFYLDGSPRTLDIGETSRGCIYRCAFCYLTNPATRGKVWRAMPADKVIERIRFLVEKYRLTGMWIRDDSFFVDINRVKKICEGIKDLDVKWHTSGTTIPEFNRANHETVLAIKKSGCHSLKFGAESGSDRVLEMIDKPQRREDIVKANLKCKEYDIVPSFSFIIGFPGEVYEEMLETVKLAQQLRKDNPNVHIEGLNIFSPFYDTSLYQFIKEKYGIWDEPKTLEEWAIRYFYGDAHRIWFDDKMSEKIKNISDISSYIDSAPRVIRSSVNGMAKPFVVTVMLVAKKYYEFRWNHLMFDHDPTLKITRTIRKMWLGH